MFRLSGKNQAAKLTQDLKEKIFVYQQHEVNIAQENKSD
jgi:hypothetical protein